MHRQLLLSQLDRYDRLFPLEAQRTGRVRRFVLEREDCFERSCLPGHVTGSAWVVAGRGEWALLTHHRKLGMWLQLGGHADGDPDPSAVALREAREESGLDELRLARWSRGAPVLPFDLDVHEIPAWGDDPAHLHFDVRYLVLARREAPLRPDDETFELRWVADAEIERFTREESVLRMARKAKALLSERSSR